MNETINDVEIDIEMLKEVVPGIQSVIKAAHTKKVDVYLDALNDIGITHKELVDNTFSDKDTMRIIRIINRLIKYGGHLGVVKLIKLLMKAAFDEDDEDEKATLIELLKLVYPKQFGKSEFAPVVFPD